MRGLRDELVDSSGELVYVDGPMRIYWDRAHTFTVWVDQEEVDTFEFFGVDSTGRAIQAASVWVNEDRA